MTKFLECALTAVLCWQTKKDMPRLSNKARGFSSAAQLHVCDAVVSKDGYVSERQQLVPYTQVTRDHDHHTALPFPLLPDSPTPFASPQGLTCTAVLLDVLLDLQKAGCSPISCYTSSAWWHSSPG